jgi:hypothetical protein
VNCADLAGGKKKKKKKKRGNIQFVNVSLNAKENNTVLTDNCGFEATNAGHICVNSKKEREM